MSTPSDVSVPEDQSVPASRDETLGAAQLEFARVLGRLLARRWPRVPRRPPVRENSSDAPRE